MCFIYFLVFWAFFKRIWAFFLKFYTHQDPASPCLLQWIFYILRHPLHHNTPFTFSKMGKFAQTKPICWPLPSFFKKMAPREISLIPIRYQEELNFRCNIPTITRGVFRAYFIPFIWCKATRLFQKPLYLPKKIFQVLFPLPHKVLSPGFIFSILIFRSTSSRARHLTTQRILHFSPSLVIYYIFTFYLPFIFNLT